MIGLLAIMLAYMVLVALVARRNPVTFLAQQAQFGVMPAGNVPSGPSFVTQDTAAQVIDLSAKGIR